MNSSVVYTNDVPTPELLSRILQTVAPSIAYTPVLSLSTLDLSYAVVDLRLLLTLPVKSQRSQADGSLVLHPILPDRSDFNSNLRPMRHNLVLTAKSSSIT